MRERESVCRFGNCYGGSYGCGCDRGRRRHAFPERSHSDTFGAKIFKSTYRIFAHAEHSSAGWPFTALATGRGFCIPRSVIVAVLLELMDGRTAQRSARP